MDILSIPDDCKIGDNFKHGKYCVIEPDVVIGDNVKIGHFVTLKSGTRIHNNVDLADYVKTTGLCIIGNDVNIRTDACISKGVIVHDKAFIGPAVMTNHTKNVMHHRGKSKQLITEIGYGSVIGSTVSIVAGCSVGHNAVVAAGSVVFKTVPPMGIYGGYPVKRLGDLHEGYELPVPDDYADYQFDYDDVVKYLPGVL